MVTRVLKRLPFISSAKNHLLKAQYGMKKWASNSMQCLKSGMSTHHHHLDHDRHHCEFESVRGLLFHVKSLPRGRQRDSLIMELTDVVENMKNRPRNTYVRNLKMQSATELPIPEDRGGEKEENPGSTIAEMMAEIETMMHELSAGQDIMLPAELDSVVSLTNDSESSVSVDVPAMLRPGHRQPETHRLGESNGLGRELFVSADPTSTRLGNRNAGPLNDIPQILRPGREVRRKPLPESALSLDQLIEARVDKVRQDLEDKMENFARSVTSAATTRPHTNCTGPMNQIRVSENDTQQGSRTVFFCSVCGQSTIHAPTPFVPARQSSRNALTFPSTEAQKISSCIASVKMDSPKPAPTALGQPESHLPRWSNPLHEDPATAYSQKQRQLRRKARFVKQTSDIAMKQDKQ